MSILSRLLFTFFLITSFQTYSQLYKSHDWDNNPIFYNLDNEDKLLASIAIKDKYLVQYYEPVIKTKNPYKLFETRHSIIRVNTDKGVNEHNRVYIPMRDVKKVIDIKARVLTKDGQIKMMDKNNIKELKNVEDYGNFKIFAIEGVVKDSQLEYIYTVEKEITTVGTIVVQKEYKVREAEVILRKPRSLTYEVKSYNGFPEFSVELVEGNKNALTSTMMNIPAMIDEKSATPDANRMKASYVVRSRYTNDMWSNLKNGVQNNYMKISSKKIRKLIADYEKFKDLRNLEYNDINTIIDYVNNNFNIIREYNPEFNSFDVIVTKKQATEQGIVKVYTSLFNHFAINYELVLTSDRYRHKFDKSFYSNYNLQELLIYFPEYKKYMIPSHVNSRLDYAPYDYISNNGVFVTKYGYEFKVIEVPDTEYTQTIRNFKLSINDNQEGLVKCHQELTGYRGSSYRGAHKYYLKNDYNTVSNF